MKRRIAVFTGSRAEYGLLYWLMKDIQASESLALQVIVSGMHLSPEFGETWRQVEADGFSIDARVEMLLSSNTAVGVVKSIGLGTIGMADALDRLRPDLLVALGDRFELLTVAQAALIMGIPLAHLHGGEVTEGAYDDAIRHAVTKLSALHFVAAEPYRDRVIQMGEDPDTVFNVGAVGLDHLSRGKRLSVEALASSLGFGLRQPYFLVTYHPVTQSEEDPGQVFSNILTALEDFPEYQVLVTYPNADNGGRDIIPRLEGFARAYPERVCAVKSLGSERYLAAMAGAAIVVGNSSSGLIEAPSFHLPAVNVGCRQQGRLCAESVIHCATGSEDISAAIRHALTPGFLSLCTRVVNPYGRGDASGQIVKVIESVRGPLRKRFHDIKWRS